jgi:hypothetical protein
MWMCVTVKDIYVFVCRTAQICKNQHYLATIMQLHHKPRRDNFFLIVVGLAVRTASITLINQVTISFLL